MSIYTKKILFIGGKGGVGKSTSAATIAWQLGKSEKKTLLVSTDPAHNLGHIFSQDIGGETTEIAENLHALEIDPEHGTKKYIDSVKENIKGTVQSTMIEEEGEYDHLVFDTALTGHTIRLLTLPELMGVWIEGLLKKRRKTNENYTQLLNDGQPVEDPIYDVLLERQNRFAKAREILLKSGKTGFIFVLNPERLPILETEKAVGLLDKYHLHVRILIVNKVLPHEADDTFLAQSRDHEQRYLKEIEETFRDQKLIRVPLLPHDITIIDELDRFSEYYAID